MARPLNRFRRNRERRLFVSHRAVVPVLIAAAAAFAAPAVGELPRGVLLGWAAGTLWLWTLLGLASIGLLIAPAAALALYALLRAPGGRLAPLVGAAAAVVVATFGLSWTG
jgi:hypothetical protein